jgi:hypothetical protein
VTWYYVTPIEGDPSFTRKNFDSVPVNTTYRTYTLLQASIKRRLNLLNDTEDPTERAVIIRSLNKEREHERKLKSMLDNKARNLDTLRNRSIDDGREPRTQKDIELNQQEWF